MPGGRRVVIGPWAAFTTPLPLERLLGALAPRQATDLRRIIEVSEGRPLPDLVSLEVARAVRDLIPDFGDRLAEIPGEPFRPRIRPELPALANASTMALRLFSRRWRNLLPTPDPTPTPFDIQIDLATGGSEDDYITDDASTFQDWDRSANTIQGWWEFRDAGRRLHVKNINVSNAENRIGVDLIYIMRDPDTVVLVQYKLLEKLKSPAEWIYRPDARLDKQIARMIKYCPTQVGRGGPVGNARVGTDFAFVKFLAPALSPRDPSDPEGMYLPAEAAARMLVNPESGPKGGAVHYVHRHRHLDGETFARLVRDRWVGSTGDVTNLLSNILGAIPAADRTPRTIAIESRIPTGAP